MILSLRSSIILGGANKHVRFVKILFKISVPDVRNNIEKILDMK